MSAMKPGVISRVQCKTAPVAMSYVSNYSSTMTDSEIVLLMLDCVVLSDLFILLFNALLL